MTTKKVFGGTGGFRTGWRMAVVALVCLASFKLAEPLIMGAVPPVWLAAGLAPAMLIFLGLRFWPGVVLGDLAALLLEEVPLPWAILIAAALGVEAVVSASIALRIAPPDPQSLNLRSTAALLCGLWIAPFVSSFLGVPALLLSDLAPEQRPWLIWWLGNGAAAVLLVTAALSWRGIRSRDLRRLHPGRVLEAIGLSLAMGVVLVLILGNFLGQSNHPLAFLLIPFSIWAGLRFGYRGASIAALSVCTLLVFGTAYGIGPFAGSQWEKGLIMLEIFVIAYTVISFLMSALLNERSETEKALRRSQEDLATTLDSIADGVIVTDRQGAVARMNPVAEKLTGWPLHEALHRPLDEVFAVHRLADEAKAENPAEGADRHRASVSLLPQTMLAARNGIRRFVATTRSPVRCSNGEVRGTVFVFRDVTREHAAEIALRESEHRHRTLIEQMQEGIVVLDLHRTIRFVNERTCQMSGYSRQELIGADALALFATPETLPQLVERLRLRSQGVSERYESSVRTKSGRLLYVQVAAVPTRARDGTITGSVAVVTDITAQREASLELERQKQAAEEASRAKDDFIASLSHELRTPLTSVLFALNALEQDPASSETLLPLLRRNVELEARLIDDLLDITSIMRGRAELHRETVDLHDCLRETVQAFEREIARKQIELRVTLDAGRHFADADPVRIRQVLLNLVKNAVKYTPGGRSIAVRSYNRKEGSEIVIEVEDTGVGIDLSLLPVIFRTFEVGERTRQFGGLGLGLPISKAIVDGHGGTLSIESGGPDQGACVRMTLSTLENPAPATPPATPAPPAPPFHAEERPIRILLVEDHDDTRVSLVKLLTRQGHEVRAIAGVREAVEAGREGQFDILISDIGLPDGTGYDLRRQLPEHPAIALSGFGMETDFRKSMEAGFSRHLVKPIDFRKLDAAIHELLPQEAVH